MSKRHAVEQERVACALSLLELVEAEAISRFSVKLSPQPYAVISFERYICPDSSDIMPFFSQAAMVSSIPFFNRLLGHSQIRMPPRLPPAAVHALITQVSSWVASGVR